MEYTIKQGESLWLDITTDISTIDATWPGTWHGEWAVSLLPLPSSAAVSGALVSYDGVIIATNTPGKWRLSLQAASTAALPLGLYVLSARVSNTTTGYSEVVVQSSLRVIAAGV